MGSEMCIRDRTVMPCSRPSRASALVNPVTACLVAVYGLENGRGVCAETDPLLIMRPPAGDCRFMWSKAALAHNQVPVRLMSTT